MVQLRSNSIRCSTLGPCKVTIWLSYGVISINADATGLPRNYMSQDIIRRILVDYFGYDVHFVMNITDIDDKVNLQRYLISVIANHWTQIIIRARHNHLLDQLKTSSTQLTPELISQANQAWLAYFSSKVGKRLSAAELPQSNSSPDVEASWQGFLGKEKSDEKWWTEAKVSDEKFTMHISSLVSV